MGDGYSHIDNSSRAIFLQLGLPFRLAAPLCGLLGQSKKISIAKNPAQQIPKSPVHKILHTHILSFYGGVSVDCSQFAGGLARPHTADNSFL
jgi:hypothetical protein